MEYLLITSITILTLQCFRVLTWLKIFDTTIVYKKILLRIINWFSVPALWFLIYNIIK